MVSSGILRRVALVRTGFSEELSASFIRVTRIGELGTTLAVTSNRRTLRQLLVTASVVPTCPKCLKLCLVLIRFDFLHCYPSLYPNGGLTIA
jgi:hypothetical protein